MAKLIHSELLKSVKLNSGVYDSTNKKYTGEGLTSIIFTDDGYIVAKGHEYYIGTATHGTGTTGLSIDGSGKLTAIDNNGNTIGSVDLPVYSASDGLKVDGRIIKHSTNIKVASNVGPTADSSTIISVPYFSYDAYGHFTNSGIYTATLNYVLSEALDKSKTMYLLGHSSTGTASTLLKDTVGIKTDANGIATLFAPNLNITNGVSGITVSDTTLDKYIENAVNDAKTQALTFKGSYTPATSQGSAAMPDSNAINGDTYKIAADGYILTAAGTTSAVSKGDTVIAVVTTSGTTKTITWDIIPSGDEEETYITISSSEQSGTYNKKTGEVVLGNAALKIVGSVADGNSGLVTGDAVYDAITGHAGIDKVGTVTTIGLYENSGLQICSTASGEYGTTNQTVTAYLRNKLLNYDLNSSVSAKTNTRLYSVQLDKDGNLAVNVPQVYSLVSGSEDTSTSNVEVASAKTSVYLNLIDGATSTAAVAGSLKLTTGNGIKLASSTSGEITITNSGITSITNSIKSDDTYSYIIGTYSTEGGTSVNLYGKDTNTWREIDVYSISSDSTSLTSASIGTTTFKTSSNFALNSNSELDLVWAEIDSNGDVKYSI